MRKSITTVLAAGALLAMASLFAAQAYAEVSPPFEQEWEEIAVSTAAGFAQADTGLTATNPSTI